MSLARLGSRARCFLDYIAGQHTNSVVFRVISSTCLDGRRCGVETVVKYPAKKSVTWTMLSIPRVSGP